MTRTSFDKELTVLHGELVKMGALVEDAIAKSVKALEPGGRYLAEETAAADRQVDDLERTIEARCLHLLLRQQPVAKDLRAISTAIKMITDMERIGDQAADIADIVLREDSVDLKDIAGHIPEMARIAVVMVSEAVGSFVATDLEAARKIIKMDDEVDHLFDVVKGELISILKTEPARADVAINALMIAKYLERIGDHAVNICEWVEFYETGIHKQTRIF